MSRAVSPASSDGGYISAVPDGSRHASRRSSNASLRATDGTKYPVLLFSRRSSTNSVSSLSSSEGKTTISFINFALLGNPTIQFNLPGLFSVAFTYAELLQYLSIFLTSRQLWLPLARSTETSSNASQFANSLTTSFLSPFAYANMTILSLSLLSLGPRRRAESLGLRRSCLFLCLVVFLVTLVLVIIDSTTSFSKARNIAVGHRSYERDDVELSTTTMRDACVQQYGSFRLETLLPSDSNSECKPSPFTRREEAQVAIIEAGKRLFGQMPEQEEVGPIEKLCDVSSDNQIQSMRLASENNQHAVIIECNKAVDG